MEVGEVSLADDPSMGVHQQNDADDDSQAGLVLPGQPTESNPSRQQGTQPTCVVDNTHEHAVYPPPMYSCIDDAPGYGGLSDEWSSAAPPTEEPPPYIPMPDPLQTPSVAELSEEDAREALLEYTTEKCCYGRKAARNMGFSDMSSTNALHYVLQSCVESRQISRVLQPYRGGAVDGPVSGAPPGPWDIYVTPPSTYTDCCSQLLTVPNSSILVMCNSCEGLGTDDCILCHGSGRDYCPICNGTPYERSSDPNKTNVRCISCAGIGTKRCSNCRGSGKRNCFDCRGSGRVLCHLNLKVKWENHVDSYVMNPNSSLPETKIDFTTTGEEIYKDENSRVVPIVHFPEQISDASRRFIHEHAVKFPLSRIIRQRQMVRVIPITTCTVSWKKKKYDFFVFGKNRKVYAPDYPQQCCSGCTII